MITDSTLREHGWRPIVSDAQAAQLLRRELKHHARWQQRENGCFRWDYRVLLAIKRGNWFKFLKNRRNGFCSIMIQRRSDSRN